MLDGYTMDNNVILLTNLPKGEYEVNGEIYHVTDYREDVVILPDSEIFRISRTKKAVGYDTPNGFLSMDDFKAKKNSHYCETDDGDEIPLTAEDYSVWKAFQKNSVVRYETGVSRSNVEYRTFPKMQDYNEFIIPKRSFTGKLTDTVYVYKRSGHVLRLLTEGFTKRGFRVSGDLAFLKADGKYIFNDFLGFKQYYRLFNNWRDNAVYGSLEYLVKMHDDWEIGIEKAFKIFDNRDKPLEELTVEKFLNSLNKIQRQVLAIDSKIKTQKEQEAALTSIKLLIESTQKQL